VLEIISVFVWTLSIMGFFWMLMLGFVYAFGGIIESIKKSIKTYRSKFNVNID